MSRCRGHWGSRRRGPRNGVTSFWLKSRAPDARDDDHRRLQAKIGELLMETELLYAASWRPAVFGPAEVDAMSGAQSISTRRAYGVQRVCRVSLRPLQRVCEASGESR